MDIADLTDEQLAAMSAPPVEGGSPDTEAGNTDSGTTTEDTTSTTADTEVSDAGGSSHEDAGATTVEDDNGADAGVEAVADSGKEEGGEAGAKPAEEEPDYKALYQSLMSPLRANGKDIEIKSIDELKSLAQMGANYTKNMQNIRHHKKTLMMLERNGMLDESKIGFLIDVANGDTAAIQKLLKEKNIDPMDVDVRGETTYQDHGNHRPSDAEVMFREQVDEIVSTPTGAETISVLNGLDQASKDMLWQTPQLMSTLHAHRVNGTYDVVAAEVNRRRTVGTIPFNEPFLSAYNQVGEEMLRAQQQKAVQAPIATRVATPTQGQAGGAGKVAAAAPTRSGGRRATPTVNPFSLSDEAFEKAFNEFRGRL